MRTVRLAEPAPDFQLQDLEGRQHRLCDYRGQIVILNFWSHDCPHVERTDQLIVGWQQHWDGATVLLPIASNAGVSPEAVTAAAVKRRLPLVLIDPQHGVADLYGAQITPQAFVIDREGKLRYRGAVDDTSFSQRLPTRFFLQEAVQSLLAGEAPRVSETPPYGCAIIREALE